MRYLFLIALLSFLAIPPETGAQTDMPEDPDPSDKKDPIPEAVSSHLESRGRTVLENLPALTDLAQGFPDPDGPDASAQEPNITLSATSSGARALGGFRNGGFWGKAKFSRAETSGARDDQLLAALGAHSQVSDRLFLGGLLLFDRTETELEGEASGRIKGNGWMAGPYFAAKHDVYPLYFEGRLLYGRSSNDVEGYLSSQAASPRDGSFNSRRWLAQVRVEGEYSIGNGTVLIPLADFSHVREEAEEFADSMGNPIPGQMVDTSKIQLGAKFSIPVHVGEGALKLRPGLRFVLTDASAPNSENADAGFDHHGRIDIGIDYRLEESASLSFNGYYSGLGRSDFELYGAGINLRMRF